MAVNKVVYHGRTLIDISGSTVTPATLIKGTIAYNAKGERIVGTAEPYSGNLEFPLDYKAVESK